MLGWLGPNAVGFIHKSTTTDGKGTTMSTNGDFTITVGMTGNIGVTATMTAGFDEIVSRVSKAENFATFDGGDGGLFHRDQTILSSAIYTVIMSGNLVDGFTTTTHFKSNSTITEATTGTPPVTTPNGGDEDDATWTIMLDAFQTGLDIAGLVPGLGEAADLLNAGIHVARGNYGDAAVSLAAMVPVLGAAATAGKLGTKAAKMAGKVAGKVDEAAAGIKQGISKMQDACKGSNCFIAGTQVLVAVDGQSVPKVALADPEDALAIDQLFAAPDVALDFDRYAAAGAFLLAAGLTVRRPARLSRRRRKSAAEAN